MADEVDYARLEGYLRALGYASRLELLSLLRVPRAISDIRLQPQQSKPGENPERPMSRQSLQDHLDRLIEAGIVSQGRAKSEDSGRTVNEFVVNQQRLYAILEELRRVCTVPGHASAAADATAPLNAQRAPARAEGPRVTLVHGLYEGKTFALADNGAPGARGFVIGRRADVHVALPYDPFVSSENAEIRRAPSGFTLTSVASAKNGTFHNWRQLERGESVPLRSGDVIGVGRSLLVFRDS